MSVMTDEEKDNFWIERFIFHSVGPSAADFALYDEAPIGAAEDFLKGRLRLTLRGNTFEFLEGSGVMASLHRIARDEDAFVHESKVLAELYQNANDDTSKRGVLIIASIRAGEAAAPFYSIIKYDHRPAFSFDVVEAEERKRVTLAEIRNNLTESPQALHKTAVIKLSPGGGLLSVRDLSNVKDISGFFRKYLQVRREDNEFHLTEKLVKALEATIEQHEADLPEAVTRQPKQRIRDAILEMDSFSEDERGNILVAVCGPLAEDSRVRRTFDRQLKAKNIFSQAFNFDRSAAPPVGRRRMVTREGITIAVPGDAADLVVREPQPDGTTRIVITTERVVRDDIEKAAT